MRTEVVVYVEGARSDLGFRLVVGKLAAENKGQTRLSRAGGKLFPPMLQQTYSVHLRLCASNLNAS
jgi:hypothetical protein